MEEKKDEQTQVENASSQEVDLSYKNGRERVKSGALGFFIGLAVIVPGVSGSAVAIIFGLYEKFLYALGNILKKFKKCFLFLLPILVGGIFGFGGGFFGVKKLIDILPFAIVALFGGLMLGAYPAVADRIKGEKINAPRIILFILGLLIPVAASLVSVFVYGGNKSLDNLSVWHYLLFLLLGYLVAITQIVPGLSATALLMVFGYFKSIMYSVSLTYWKSNPQVFIVYVCLAVGFAVGLVTVSKLMSNVLERHKTPSFFCICGLSLGAAVTMFFNPDIYKVYTDWAINGLNVWELLLGVVLFIGGIFAAYALVKTERRKNSIPS